MLVNSKSKSEVVTVDDKVEDLVLEVLVFDVLVLDVLVLDVLVLEVLVLDVLVLDVLVFVVFMLTAAKVYEEQLNIVINNTPKRIINFKDFDICKYLLYNV